MKKRHLTVMPGVLLALLLIGLFIGCSGSETTDSVFVAAESVTISEGVGEPSVAAIVGVQLPLTAVVVPDTATGTLTWMSTSVPVGAAEVDADGVVTPLAVGTAVITVTAVGEDPAVAIFDVITVNIAAASS